MTTVIRWWTITYLVRLTNAHYRFGEDIWTHFSRGHLVCHANSIFLISVLHTIIYLNSECIPTKILNSEPKTSRNHTKGGFMRLLNDPNPREVHERNFSIVSAIGQFFLFSISCTSLLVIIVLLMWCLRHKVSRVQFLPSTLGLILKTASRNFPLPSPPLINS